MMQAIAETVFDVFYLGFALVAGLMMLAKGEGPLVKKAGLMTLLLGAGDSFHLVPRCYALWTTGLEANAAALGIGKFITSITMTVLSDPVLYLAGPVPSQRPEEFNPGDVGIICPPDCPLPASAK